MKKSILLITLISSGMSFAQNSIYWNGAQWVESEAQNVSVSSGAVPTVYNPTTGKTWMDRNVGASRVALSSGDLLSFGSLFQWGRAADGHQHSHSQTTTTLSSTLTPGHDKFIISNTSLSDWRSKSNMKQDALVWSGSSGINNPCPSGFRVPSTAEWQAEFATWTPGNDHVQRAFNSVLRLPAAGGRVGRTGEILHRTEIGSYWTSQTNGSSSSLLTISSGQLAIITAPRSYGHSIRCIKN